MRYFLILLLLLYSATTSAQILNAESLRKVSDTSGFSGATSLNFALKRTTNDHLTISNAIHVQYKMHSHLILFKNDIVFEKVEGDKLENSWISHLRYNYQLRPRIAWEVFTQGQFNKVSLIDFRGLIGTGPRFKLTNNENYRFYLGTLVMFEYEETLDNVTPLQRNFRGSAYLSFSLYPTKNVSITSTTYFQPLLSQWSDYRISSQTSLLLPIVKSFSVSINHTFTYDTFPAVGIPNSQYSFTTGFAYSFD